MSKKEKCQHGLSPVYMQGCPHCCTLAMDGLDLLRSNGLSVPMLFVMMYEAWPTPEAFASAKDRALTVLGQHKAKATGAKP